MAWHRCFVERQGHPNVSDMTLVYRPVHQRMRERETQAHGEFGRGPELHSTRGCEKQTPLRCRIKYFEAGKMNRKPLSIPSMFGRT
eukprot:scaffold370_cov349-Pavlova_lutheri.AAC.6